MVEILGPLPARPPTPPRPGSRIDQNQDDDDTPVAAQTPADTPQPASARAPPSSRGSKRVTFSPWLHTTIDSPWSAKQPESKESPNPGSPHMTEIRPFKSILKETNSPIPVWSPNVDKFTTESLDMLLESVTQQLAGVSVTSRLDAYMQFFGALRTYDGLPAGKDIAEKLGLITGFIQRDVSRDLIKGVPLDTNLANQALKLSAAFVWHSDISGQLPDEFKVFIVEHAITCLHEAKVPKSVLTHYMSILSTQNFSPKIMTNPRIIRLLTVLQDVTKHVTGKAIALHRLSIYQRLFAQSKSTFVTQAPLWMEQLIFGLLHHMKDTRLKAISLGFQIAMTMGPNLSLSKSIRDLFDRTLQKDRKLVMEIRERMSRMVATVESGVHVPQIWSIIILFLRNKTRSLDQWEHFKEWVLVLQKCFNCSEPAIKAQAIVGWNRFVFAVGPNETTSRSLLKMLGKPILSQLERKKSDKTGASPTQLSLGSYNNLLYYAFRPSPPHHYLDLVWEEYVSAPATSTFTTASLSDNAARVLSNLLWASQAKVWSENRINDSTKMEADELPSLDPRWVRSRVTSIVKVLKSLFKSSVWNDEDLKTSNIALAWNSFSSALSLASNKEITPSGESMQAVASVVGLLNYLLMSGPSSLNAAGDNCTDVFFERFRFLSTTIISSLGGISFTEKLLMKTIEETFQTSIIRTGRESTPGTNSDSPILHLLRAVGITSMINEPTSSYRKLVHDTIESACKSKISRGSRLELVRQCAELTIVDTSSTSPSVLSEVIWTASAGAAANALQSFPIESSRERDGSVSRDYENITKILASGVQFPAACSKWAYLLESFVRVVRTEKGDRSLATLIIEPVAEHLAPLSANDTYFPAAALLAHSMSIPFMQERILEIDALVGKTLQSAYKSFDLSRADGLAGFLESLTSLLGSGVPSFRHHALESLQASLALWIKDERQKIDVEHKVDSRTLTACRALSSAVLNVLQTTVLDQLTTIQKFDTIICAGLESPHLSRTKRFVDFWISTNSASDPLAAETSIGQSLQKALAILSAGASEQNEDVQDVATFSSVGETAASQSEIKQPISRNILPRSVNPDSSPVIGMEHQSSVETTDLNEPQLPTNSLSEVPEEPMVEDVSAINPAVNQREMFRMIESIRSSSPANTPGKSGYDTPVHLRRFHISNGTGAIPLTPTLAPTENDEGFIGSSPTPATRDPTPAATKEVPSLSVPDITMTNASDLPSSPPEYASRSPSPQKRTRPTRSERRRSARAKKALLRNSSGEQSASNSPKKPVHDSTTVPEPSPPSQADQPEDSKENNGAPQADERPPSRRTRSALGQSMDNKQSSAPPTPAAVETPVKPTDDQVPQSNRSKTASKRRKRKNAARAANSQSQQSESQQSESQQPDQSADVSATLALPEYNLDSSSEDMETQIASQLEQDLESAVDLGDRAPTADKAQAVAEQATVQSSKKRKREEDDSRETRAKNAQERRRSSRLTASKDELHAEAEEPQPTPSEDLAQESTTVPPENHSAKPETATPRRSTRNFQRREEPPQEKSLPATQLELTESQEPPKQDEPAPPPPKRSRKSLRLDDQPPSTVPEEQSIRSKSNRSRRSRSTRTEVESSQPSQEQQTPSQLLSGETQQHQNQDGTEGLMPERIVVENTLAENTHLVSTEEVTDSQMTDMAPSIEPTTTRDTQTMDVNKPQEKSSAAPIQPTTNVFTTEVQTEPSPMLDAGSSEKDLATFLQKVLDEAKSATLDLNGLRQVEDLLFNIRVAAQDALRRN
ncbi:hypothetical protein N7532_009477 [Penicillium argentinense]|uniref:Telomere-associated protein Rif1 N-terminal domain-containing protein n=1 Tax=Penicillium argentinense TaxID=1131581 RepID=A0A9W9K2L8_9EURO|nr:uncharacterized protein N7532_009477 [Penicillium argentinense]KAJ5090793.1 hypothetical protein N7532_009477 [Penicillium argentinense]